MRLVHACVDVGVSKFQRKTALLSHSSAIHTETNPPLKHTEIGPCKLVQEVPPELISSVVPYGEMLPEATDKLIELTQPKQQLVKLDGSLM